MGGGSFSRIVVVDLGGTSMRASSVHSDGTSKAIVRRPTLRTRSAEEIVADLVALIRAASAPEETPAAIGIGVPTVVDERGVLTACDNLPTMGGIDLRTRLIESFGCPVQLENDANCFALGEWWLGSGRGARNVCGLTLGTGIGCGLVLDGRLYRGSHGWAGEIWQSPLGSTTVESQVCGRALEAFYARATGAQRSAEEIAARAASGEVEACDVFGAFGRALGNVVAILLATIDPEVVVFGGSIAKAFPYFRGAMEEALAMYSRTSCRVRLEPSKLGELAPLLGAARLFLSD
jgi:glucokinase